MGPRHWRYFFFKAPQAILLCSQGLEPLLQDKFVSVCLCFWALESWWPRQNTDLRHFHFLISKYDLQVWLGWINNELEWSTEEISRSVTILLLNPKSLPGDFLSLSPSDALEQMVYLTKLFAIFNFFDDLRPASSLGLHRSLQWVSRQF